MSALAGQYETILLERPSPEILVVTLNRPNVRNAFDTRMATEMLNVFQALARASEGVRAVVLTGAGEHAFCAGADLKERQGMDDETWRRQHTVFEHMAGAVMDCPVPVIAAVDGVAYGGGCELMLACDFAYATTESRFALPEVTIGLIPGIGGTQNLPRRVGPARAKEIILTGRPFTAEDALEWGLVNRLCTRDDLLSEVLATAERITGNAPLAVAQGLHAIDEGMGTSLSQGLSVELDCYDKLVGTADVTEGISAFNEKRAPIFRGR
ncbi:enoyl-CoA hydratase/isomerase family protein [Marivibrio halodurans]|uniref:Enoyl-CoA hydratase/isomerase family protein n=1 Tax=Marivibrio halodurans TaxID=2039722 RepID=A0A8J7S144_9PROT|nr:enoyl-CoA hydratase-related protein [Marivibrio halodurans]MBP5856708.1 enoyl-CoA hydratase/isomerase family protein [Marivibrio halodurans]